MNTIETAPTLSVVVPSYGCRECLEELCARIHAALADVIEFEIVIVDDRSPDNAWPITVALSKKYARVRGIRLSRNFGQHIAITAGLAAARGQRVVVMDCDLQDPPERIPDLIAELEKGYDLVLARRVERSHSRFRQLSAKLYFTLMQKLTGQSLDGSYGTFSILSRKVVDAFLQFGERERHYLFILRWLGFHCGTIEYEHADRHAGTSSYSFARLVRHAIGGLFFHTSVFLNWIVYIGLFLTALSVAGGCYFIFRHLTATSLPGWTSLAVAILFSTGSILASVGMVGLYVARIFEAGKARPLYVVDRECSCADRAIESEKDCRA